MDFKKINFKQGKYYMPLVLYFPLLFIGYFATDMFAGNNTAKDPRLKETTYLSDELPGANTDSVLGSKFENTQDTYGNVTDLSGMKEIESDKDSVQKKEDYASRYSAQEASLVAQQEQEREEEKERLRAMQERVRTNRRGSRSSANEPSDFVAPTTTSQIESRDRRRRQEAYKSIEENLKASSSVFGSPNYDPYTGQYIGEGNPSATGIYGNPSVNPYNNIPRYDANGNPLPMPSGNGYSNSNNSSDGSTQNQRSGTESSNGQNDPLHVVRKTKTSSDYFNTISSSHESTKLIKAIIDENIKVVAGSRVRLRLLDDIAVGDVTIKKGTYLYANMTNFSQQRVQGQIQSIFANDDIFQVSLSMYDTDGLEGLYVPESAFRESSKEILESATSGGSNIVENNGTSTGIKGWANQAVQNASQRVMNSLSKMVRKNSVRLKYGTLVYLLDGSQQKQPMNIKRK